MGAILTIDQAGLPPGVPGVSRDDGLDTGALVTLTNTGGGGGLEVKLLWVPPEDVTALPSLAQTSPSTFTFSPTPLTYGRHRIEMVTDRGTPQEVRTVHTFGIALPNGIVIPAANELADPSTTRQNDLEAARREASESNAPFGPFVGRSPYGWWPWINAVSRGVGASAPGVKFHLRAGDNIVVPADYQYIVKAPGPILDGGASLTISPGAQLVIIP